MNKYNLKKPNKLNLLLKESRKVFHINDLALLWQIFNKNTLHTTVKRYVDKGILIRIQKGFYSVTPLENLDSVELGIKFLHTYAYLSAETVLFQQGIISQPSSYITLISNKSKKFRINNYLYLSRQLKPVFLHNGTGLIEENSIKKATSERAVADMLYYNPYYHFDGFKLINWQKVKEMQKAIGYI